MRKNIASVIDAFHSHDTYQDKTCRTDGRLIYSYAMPIAAHSKGKIVVLDRVAAPSATTRSHIDAVRKAFPECLVMPSLPEDYEEIEGDDDRESGEYSYTSASRGDREDFHSDG